MHLFHYDEIEKWWLYDSNEKPSKLSLELKQTQKLWINRRYIIILSDTRSNQIPTRSKKGKLNPNFDTIIKIQGKEAADAERIGLSNFLHANRKGFRFWCCPHIDRWHVNLLQKKIILENGEWSLSCSRIVFHPACGPSMWNLDHFYVTRVETAYSYRFDAYTSIASAARELIEIYFKIN